MCTLLQKKLLMCYFLPTILAGGSIIETTSGPVEGKLVIDEGAQYVSYLGIPYGEPPTGSLRFKPPLPKRPWRETFRATKYGPMCFQGYNPVLLTDVGMSEDCLTLNIYVSAEKTRSLLPVLVFVYGGMFLYFSGDDELCGPEQIMKYGVILVTFNYRLGAFGFLSIQTEEAAGNAGLKDAILAMKWIKTNIEKFGGDPNKITIGGNSSGAAIVHFLVLSERSKGLFQRAIMMGGNALSFRYLNRYPVDNTKALGAKLGFATHDLNDLVKNLRGANESDIAFAQGNETDIRNGVRYFAPFVPVIEQESEHAVIVKHPLELIKSGASNIPILAGRNSQEGAFMINFINNYRTRNLLNENFELCIPSNKEYPYGSEESKDLAKDIREFYFKNDNITLLTLQNYVDLISDLHHNFSTDRWIKIIKSVSDTYPVYYYVFDFDGDLNVLKCSAHINFNGMAHGAEQGHIFVTKHTFIESASKESKAMMHIATTLFTNFVKYGNPTPEEKREADVGECKIHCNMKQYYLLLNDCFCAIYNAPQDSKPNFWNAKPTQESTYVKVKWTDCGTNRNYLLLNTRPSMVHGTPDEKRLNFWYKVYQDYEKYVQSGGRLEPKIVP